TTSWSASPSTTPWAGWTSAPTPTYTASSSARCRAGARSPTTVPRCPSSTAPTPSRSGSTPRAGWSTTAGSNCAASRSPPRGATSASSACPSASRCTGGSWRRPSGPEPSGAGRSPVVPGRLRPAGGRHQALVAVEDGVPPVALLHEAPPGRPEPVPQRPVLHQQVDGGLELGEAPVGQAAAAAPALALEDVTVPLHQRRLPVGPRLAQDHGEALEVRRLHQRQGPGQRRLLHGVVDEAGDHHVGVGVERPHRIADDGQGQRPGVAPLVGGEVVEQLLRALGRVDPA